jgi:hypothetical protein
MTSKTNEPQDVLDARAAYWLATNCRLYEDGPGPAQLNIGSDHEPHLVSRTEAWRGTYAQFLLIDLDADHTRARAAAEHCRRDYRATPAPAFWISVLRARLTAQRGVRAHLSEAAKALSPPEMHLLRLVHEVSVELCERAVKLIEDAGATTDDTVRRRLVAGARQPRTYSVSTRTGGLHLYFRAPTGSQLRDTIGEAGLGWECISSRSWYGLFSSLLGSKAREALGSFSFRRAVR